jgi:hypothetical protein
VCMPSMKVNFTLLLHIPLHLRTTTPFSDYDISHVIQASELDQILESSYPQAGQPSPVKSPDTWYSQLCVYFHVFSISIFKTNIL